MKAASQKFMNGSSGGRGNARANPRSAGIPSCRGPCPCCSPSEAGAAGLGGTRVPGGSVRRHRGSEAARGAADKGGRLPLQLAGFGRPPAPLRARLPPRRGGCSRRPPPRYRPAARRGRAGAPGWGAPPSEHPPPRFLGEKEWGRRLGKRRPRRAPPAPAWPFLWHLLCGSAGTDAPLAQRNSSSCLAGTPPSLKQGPLAATYS